MEYPRTSPIGKMVFIWPLISVVASLALWVFIDMKIASERAELSTLAMKEAVSLSRVYAAYLTRGLEQMDQITMHVKSDWERHRNLNLNELKRDGLFTSSEFVAVAILDRNGKSVTSTLPIDTKINFADRDYFLFHRSNNSTALRIGTPLVSRATGKTVVYFSRRLDSKDDAFDGIVLIAVDPNYFVAFYDNSILGNFGLLAVAGSEGELRATSIGGNAFKLDQPAFLRTEGIRHIDNDRMEKDGKLFSDKQSRYVAWHDLKSYPMSVAVGLSKPELFAPHEESWNTYRRFGIGGTIFLFLFAAVGSYFGFKLSKREMQALAIRKTYRVATEGAHEGFFILRPVHDKSGDIADWEFADSNERGAAFFGLNCAKLIGKHLSSIFSEQQLLASMEELKVAHAAGSYEDEYKVPDDSPIQASWLHRRMVRTESGLAVNLRDITATKKNEQELTRLANEDALTELPNRHWLMRFLPLALERAGQNKQRLAILFIDLDEFKNINDTLGHSIGDELLKIAAQRVKAVLRPHDKIVRLGGDEFTVIVEQVSSKDNTAVLAQRIVQALKSPIELVGRKHVVGASVGISLYPDDGTDAEMLLKSADIAMYSVKANGKGNYQFFEAQLYENLKRRLNGEQALRYAIEHDHFILHYQPRVNTMTGEMSGMEALVRWMDPERGMVPPLEFIPLAESTGLILPLGELVIDKACQQIALWKKKALPSVPISINVSPRQFHEGDIRSRLTAAIERYQIESQDIQIEITESAMMGDDAEITALLADIRSLGIKLLVDDFGTGYSSLSQLQRLDMDVLKVDRAFTHELGQTEEGQIFFKAIVSMAHALGMKVTAEGVETIQQLAILRALSCDEIQGYFISRPLQPNDMEVLLNKQFIFPVEVRLAS